MIKKLQNKITKASLSKYVGYFFLSLFVLQWQSCAKDKFDKDYDFRPEVSAMRKSNARIVNLATYNQLKVGDDSLTNFVSRDPNDPDFYKFPGTKYFPETGRLGKTWIIPQVLFNDKESALFEVHDLAHQNSYNKPMSFTAMNSNKTPMDYYLLPNTRVEGIPNVYPVIRGINTPSKPDHFKIRVINLTGKLTDLSGNFVGRLESLEGAVSLAYADGTKVSSQTSQITSEAKASPYIELPYGTYQFKILTEDDRQIPAVSYESDDIRYKLLDPQTSTLPRDINNPTNLTFAPVQYYAPGGVYTLVVSPRSFRYYTNEKDESVPTLQNGFDIITDLEPEINTAYCRAQVINAWKTQNVIFKVNGKNLGDQLAFGKAGSYNSVFAGNHKIEAFDESGKTITSVHYEMRAGQNYSIWLHPDAKGQPTLLVVANDLSGVNFKAVITGFTQSAEDDGTYNRGVTRFPFMKRYLNLSPDNNSITFTHNNGQYLSKGTRHSPDANLQLGKPNLQFPLLATNYLSGPFELLVYRSSASKIPGQWADDIPFLTNLSFVENPNLYEQSKRKLPVHEAGYYTVALIGQSKAKTPSEIKARILIVKHNK